MSNKNVNYVKILTNSTIAVFCTKTDIKSKEEGQNSHGCNVEEWKYMKNCCNNWHLRK